MIENECAIRAKAVTEIGKLFDGIRTCIKFKDKEKKKQNKLLAYRFCFEELRKHTSNTKLGGIQMANNSIDL